MPVLSATRSTKFADTVDAKVIQKLLKQAPLGSGQTVIVCQGSQLVAHRGALKRVEALDVAVHVADGWREAGQSLRVQFMRLPFSPESRILLTCPLRDTFRLILVDSERAEFVQLHKLCNQLLAILEVAGIDRKPV